MPLSELTEPCCRQSMYSLDLFTPTELWISLQTLLVRSLTYAPQHYTRSPETFFPTVSIYARR